MGHPVLRARARAIDVGEIKSSRIQQLIDDMFETMTEYQGVGLAAPQVHASVRLFVAGFAPDPDGEDDEERVPLMTADQSGDHRGRSRTWSRTGKAASASRTSAARSRAPATSSCAPSIGKGKRFEMPASGFTARVIQHETDHLDGVLFFDRMTSFETLTFLEEFGRYWSERGARAVKEE